MNKKQLKELIKPIVKECVKESLLEEGLLSNIVQEVTKGVTACMPIVEQAPISVQAKQPTQSRELDFNKINENKKKINEYKKGLLDAIGGDAYNGVDLFEGTEPMSAQKPQGSVDLGNTRDAGVDISSIIGGANKIWQSMK